MRSAFIYCGPTSKKGWLCCNSRTIVRANNFRISSLWSAPFNLWRSNRQGCFMHSYFTLQFTGSLNTLPNDCIDVTLKFDNCDSTLCLPPSFNVMFPTADTWYALATSPSIFTTRYCALLYRISFEIVYITLFSTNNFIPRNFASFPADFAASRVNFIFFLASNYRVV